MKKLLQNKKIRDSSLALGGMIVGALVGILVQVGVESTGMLGPSVDELLAEQESNFEEVNAHIDSLRASTDDPAVASALGELAALLQRQQALNQQAGNELVALNDEVAAMRDRSLAESGFSSGADIWLGKGESISVGDRRNSFGVMQIYDADASVSVSLNSQPSRLYAGGSVATDQCQVFFKQPRRSSDKRAGFDVICD